jgi:hypothetical protein
MLFRAVFWLGLVALLMPRAGSIEISGAPTPSGAAGIANSAADDLQDVLLQRLAVVKADVEAAEQSRADDGGWMSRQH